MKEENKEESIYLNNPNIIEWERPPRIERSDRIHLGNLLEPNASTELISYVGFDVLDEMIGEEYYIVASAAKYNANISLMGKTRILMDSDKPENKPEELLLFAGSIAIYSWGEIPGIEIEGYDFIRQGRIFSARKNTEDLKLNQGLKKLVLEDTEGIDSIKRIKAIIRGYENQLLARNDGEFRARHNEYSKGKSDCEEETFGTFGRRRL